MLLLARKGEAATRGLVADFFGLKVEALEVERECWLFDAEVAAKNFR